MNIMPNWTLLSLAHSPQHHDMNVDVLPIAPAILLSLAKGTCSKFTIFCTMACAMYGPVVMDMVCQTMSEGITFKIFKL